MNRLILLLTFLLLSISVMAGPPSSPPEDDACTVNADCTDGQECDIPAGECFAPVEQADGETCPQGQVWNRRSGTCAQETVAEAQVDCNAGDSSARSTPDSTGGSESNATGSATQTQ